jgi:hypothetical protein
MSLYNDIANSLSKRGLTSAISGGIDKALGGISTGNVFGDAIGRIGVGMARNAAIGLVNKYIPPSMQRLVNAGTGAVGDIMNGDFGSAGLRLLDSGYLGKLIPGMDGVGSQARYWGTPTPLFGGISPAEAKRIYDEMRSVEYCKKNLFLIEVDSNLVKNISGRFNLFATEVEYSPYTITGEKKKIGAAHADIVNSSDPVELRITTLDDKTGFIKNWFAAHCLAAAGQDGTVGVPYDYVVDITIVHGFVTKDSSYGGYVDIGKYRAANMDLSLSRREDGLEEIQLSFVQADTFMKV